MNNHDPASITDTDDADEEFDFIFPQTRPRRNPDGIMPLIEALDAERLRWVLRP